MNILNLSGMIMYWFASEFKDEDDNIGLQSDQFLANTARDY